MTTASAHPDGRITAERLDRIFLIGIDRPKKLNGFSPKMLTEMAEAFTAFEHDDEAWVGLLFAEGPHFTAGLELDKVAPVMRERGSVYPVGSVDPLSLRPPLRTKPLVCAVQGICFTLGIELMLATDIVVAADDCRFAQIEVKRGIMPTGGATIRMVERAGWGNASAICSRATSSAPPRRCGWASCRRWFRQDGRRSARSRSPARSPSRHRWPSAPHWRRRASRSIRVRTPPFASSTSSNPG